MPNAGAVLLLRTAEAVGLDLALSRGVAPWRRPLVIDVDATLVTAHSEKECAAPTFKRGFGFHPLWASLDHGPEDAGDPLALGRRRSISNCTVNRRTSRSSAPI